MSSGSLGRGVVDVCGLRVIHERLVVRDVVTSVYDRVVAGESGVMLAGGNERHNR